MTKKLRPIFKVIIAYFIFVIAVDSVILLTTQGFSLPGTENLYQRGMIITVKPYAWLFVHGTWTYGNCTAYWRENKTKIDYICKDYKHITGYNGNQMDTLELVEWFYARNYTHVWGTWCHAGDEPFIESDREQHYWYNVTYYPDSNTTSRVFMYGDIMGGTNNTPWPDYVVRNTKPGITVPIFTGFGIALTSWED